jgi:hypothetical protein
MIVIIKYFSLLLIQLLTKDIYFLNEILRIDKYIETKHKIEVQFADMNSLYITFLVFNSLICFYLKNR